MAAEFYISFNDTAWLREHSHALEERICGLGTFVQKTDRAFWLLGSEPGQTDDRWRYDVRLIMLDNHQILMEISAHPKSVESDLSSLLSWLRSQTDIFVHDEDGEAAGW